MLFLACAGYFSAKHDRDVPTVRINKTLNKFNFYLFLLFVKCKANVFSDWLFIDSMYTQQCMHKMRYYIQSQ